MSARMIELADAHVLVVDDEAAIREMVARILRLHGFQVPTASRGDQAVLWIRQDPNISLAILDWRMPDMMGDEIFDRLTEIRPGVRVNVMSGECPDAV